MRIRQLGLLVAMVSLVSIWAQPLMGKSDRGYLIVHVNPPETYIYADGEPVVESLRHYIILTAGKHEIEMYNYGYKPEIRDVTIKAHKWWNIRVNMQPIPGRISGPWGCITLEGAPRAAVLLNGKDPAVFFVGHGDEFNNERIWHQELIVPPGKQQLTVEYMETPPWTTTVDVKANQRVVVDAYKGVRKTVPWSRGEQLGELPRFHAGLASAEVAVEKVSGRLAASTGQVDCGDSAHLTWSSTGAGETEINGKPVKASGDESVKPLQSTEYEFRAAGPGGVYTSDATVNVDNSINASLHVSPTEIQQGKGPATATVTWSAPNATSVSITPIGSVSDSGSRAVQIPPSTGPAGETVTYTLHATNTCGGTETRTASLRVMVPEQAALENKLNLNSVYFPTDWPTMRDPQDGLVASQEARLAGSAADFKEYISLQPGAKLILGGHADERGTEAYNQALSERRADLVKRYLVEHGIPADKIETRAYGKDKNLTDQQVEALTAQNPNITPQERERVLRRIALFRLANNRRVDIRLSTGQKSQRYYPFNSADMKVLMEEKEPAATQVASLR